MSLQLVTQPAVEPVSLEQCKAQLELLESETGHDAKLRLMLAASRRDVERMTRRALITQTWRLRLPEFRQCRIYLPRPPLQSVTSVVYEDADSVATTLSASLYQTDTQSSPGFIEPAVNQVWPSTETGNRTAVTVTYVAGYGNSPTDVPAEFRQLILELVAFRFYYRGDMDSPIPQHIKWSLEALHCGAKYGYYGVMT